MSQENIKKFVKIVNHDKSLQDKIKGFTGIPEESIRKLINLAKEIELEFTQQDWEKMPECETPGMSGHGFGAWSSEIILPWMK
ncbi:Nif11 domain-containing protein [Candidatus Magnetomoraceae bacterium gMMP-15]